MVFSIAMSKGCVTYLPIRSVENWVTTHTGCDNCKIWYVAIGDAEVPVTFGPCRGPKAPLSYKKTPVCPETDFAFGCWALLLRLW